MLERSADFEWRGEGEGAQIVLYAPDDVTAEQAFEQTLPAASLPCVVSPVYAAASGIDLGWVAASETHAAPDLVSAPARGLLLIADAPAAELGVSPGEAGDSTLRNLSEVSVLRFGRAEVRRAVEDGALWAAEEGLISEEDLALFGPTVVGEPDALPRRALSAGERDFDRRQRVAVYRAAEILYTERAEALDLSSGALVLCVRTASEDLGRIALAAHRERILGRVWSGDFGATAELPAAPSDTGEAADFLAAAQAIANYADARAALRLYELRQALAEKGGTTLQTAWRLGGLSQEDGLLLHRRNLTAVKRENALVVRDSVAVGTGAMRGSAPPFGMSFEEDSSWAWEEAGLLERVASLVPVGR